MSEGEYKDNIYIFGPDANPGKVVGDTELLFISTKTKNTVQKVRHKGKEWWLKEVADQESSVESMTGAIYRYAISSGQKKVRLVKSNVVASKHMEFISFRDVFEENTDLREFSRNLLENLADFYCLIWFAIAFLENDLSSANWGITENGEIVKIDHGQSLNSLRISDESKRAASQSFNKIMRNPLGTLKKVNLRYAPKKYFRPIIPRPDRRKLKDREMILGSKVRYELTFEFIDMINYDFLMGRITRSYILGISYSPSIMPYFDARLIQCFEFLGSERFNTTEQLKYYAIAKIIFTCKVFYSKIAKNAAPYKLNTTELIIQSIVSCKNNLLEIIKLDPDFKVWVFKNSEAVKNAILNSSKIMMCKPNGKTFRGSSTHNINAPYEALDWPQFSSFKNEGERLSKQYNINSKPWTLESRCWEFTSRVTIIYKTNWRIDGKSKTLRTGKKSVKFPIWVYNIHESLFRIQNHGKKNNSCLLREAGKILLEIRLLSLMGVRRSREEENICQKLFKESITFQSELYQAGIGLNDLNYKFKDNSKQRNSWPKTKSGLNSKTRSSL